MTTPRLMDPAQIEEARSASGLWAGDFEYRDGVLMHDDAQSGEETDIAHDIGDSYSEALAAMLNAVPSLLSHIDAQAGEIERLRSRIWKGDDGVGHGACPSCEYNAAHGGEAEELRKGIETLIADGGLVDDPRGLLLALLDRVDARDSLAYVTELDEVRASIERLARERDEAIASSHDAAAKAAESTSGATDSPSRHGGRPENWARLDVSSRARLRFWLTASDLAFALDRAAKSARALTAKVYLWTLAKASDAENWGEVESVECGKDGAP
jgi:hypothetical protein